MDNNLPHEVPGTTDSTAPTAPPGPSRRQFLGQSGRVAAGVGAVHAKHAERQAMVDRHEQVSRNKNRQRWCYLVGDAVVRDDLRPIGYGCDAMRFPQVSSLCRYLGLKREEVSGGR